MTRALILTLSNNTAARINAATAATTATDIVAATAAYDTSDTAVVTAVDAAGTPARTPPTLPDIDAPATTAPTAADAPTRPPPTPPTGDAADPSIPAVTVNQGAINLAAIMAALTAMKSQFDSEVQSLRIYNEQLKSIETASAPPATAATAPVHTDTATADGWNATDAMPTPAASETPKSLLAYLF